MALAATFDPTWLPQVGASLSEKPRVKKIQFGDGYQQRVTDGINTNLERWSLTFKGNPAVNTAIDAFLSARNGTEAFNWTTPKGRAIAVVCSGWSETIDDFGWTTLTCEFEQVAEK